MANFLVKLVSDSCVAVTESISFKEELDNVRARLVDETTASLKPGKSDRAPGSAVPGGSTCTMAAWKRVEPLTKAVDVASTDGA